MPKARNTNSIMSFQNSVVFHLLPIPEPEFPIRITRHHPPAIAGKTWHDSIPCIYMTSELLLAHELEPSVSLISDNLVVHRLAYEELLVWMQRNRRDRMHRRFRDVLHDHRDTVLPKKDLLIIRRGQKPTAIFAERDSVYCTKMLVVFLHDARSVCVPLHGFLVRTTTYDNVLLRSIWVHGHTKRRLLVREGADNTARLRVPILYVLVVGHAVKTTAIFSKIHISYSLVMTHVRAQALALVVVVPYLYLRVQTAR
mmetsp:Transcript_18236/g.49000  ORF Transcript_18236/g.49000 Transcript_18236/m.49000 type:complete len:255 (+) Transcript_18236:289-1053(+)